MCDQETACGETLMRECGFGSTSYRLVLRLDGDLLGFAQPDCILSSNLYEVFLARFQLLPRLAVRVFSGLNLLTLPGLPAFTFLLDAGFVLSDGYAAIAFRGLPGGLCLAFLDVLGLEFLHFARHR